MKIKFLITVTSIALSVSGLVFLVAPKPFLAVSGIHLDLGTTYLTRLFGLAFIAIGIISWYVKDSQDKGLLKAYSIAAFIQTGIGLVVCAEAALSGTVNIYGWSNIFLYGFFALGYGYYLITSREKQ